MAENQPTSESPELIRMTDSHQQKILNNYERIVDCLTDIDEVIDILLEKQCFGKDIYEQIKGEKTSMEKIRKLLSYLLKSSDIAYYYLLHAIEYTQSSPDLYDLLKDDKLPKLSSDIKGLFLFGHAKEYYHKLKQFHLHNLKKVASNSPLRHDIRNYVALTMYPQQSEIEYKRHGFREHSMLQTKSLGTPIQPSELFKATDNDQTVPRTVLMLGCPGAGKTATAYHLLDAHTNGTLWSNQFLFAVLILFREVNMFDKDTKLTFKDILFNAFGPVIEDREKVWRYLNKHQETILIILDGYDEYHHQGSQPFRDVNQATSPDILLQNLIKGNILPNAHLLITSRIHSVKALQSDVNRTIELAGLTPEDLQDLIQKKLSANVADKLFTYITTNDNVTSLCAIPANAIGLIDFVYWQTRGKDIPLDFLPHTRACLLLYLIVYNLQNHDYSLRDNTNLTAKEVIRSKADTLQKLSKLAYTSLVLGQGPRQLFTEEELTAHNLTVQEVTDSGLMSGHITTVADHFRPIQRVLLSFKHLTYQEELSAVYMVKNADQAELNYIVETNDGGLDMVLQLMLGLLGDPICRDLLSALGPDSDPNTYIHRAKQLLHDIWISARRYDNDGELFCVVSLAESLQYDMSSSLAKIMATPLNTMNMWNTSVSSGYSNSVVEYLKNIHKEDRFSDVLIRCSVDSSEVSSIVSSEGFTGLTLRQDYTADKLGVISEVINSTSTLKQLKLLGQRGVALPQSTWIEFNISNNNSIQCLGLLNSMLDDMLPQNVWDSLHHLKALHTLNLSGYNLSCSDNVSPLEPLKSLSVIRHLKLQDCNLCPSCMQEMTELMLNSGLVWLDISENPILDEGVTTLTQGLCDSECVLDVLQMYKCEISGVGVNALWMALTGKRSPRYLYADSNNMNGSDDLSLLTLSNLVQLELEDCKLSPEAVCSILQPLRINTELKWLNLSGYDMSTGVTGELLLDVLLVNTTLQTLCIRDTNLTDVYMDRLMNSINSNNTLKLLDLGFNWQLTSRTIVRVVQHSSIQYFGMYALELGTEGWKDVAAAIIHNKHLVSCLVGDAIHNEDLVGFLHTLYDYPLDGPLQSLMVWGDSAILATHVPSLRKTLSSHTSLHFVTGVYPFYVLSGLLFRDFSTDLISWLTEANVYIK